MQYQKFAKIDFRIQLDHFTISGISVTVARNSYGRQRESCEQKLIVSLNHESNAQSEYHGVFIRAPKIIKINDSEKVQMIAKKAENDEIVGVRQGNLMATSFHPELTDDLRFHKFFTDMIKLDLEQIK